MSASRRPSRPGGRSTGPGRTRAGRRPAPGGRTRREVRRVRVRPRHRISRRAAVIALVLSALALAYAYPLRTYVEQRVEINRLETEQEEQRERIEGLESERLKWDDPEYVKAQIRSKLLLVEPGEDLVIVHEGEDPEAGGDGQGASASESPWYEELVTSFEDADQLEQEEVED